MKKIIVISISVFFLLAGIGAIDAGMRGDLNLNGEIDLEEAIYARQVVTGCYPDIPPSCTLEGKGPWAEGKDYGRCDVVKHGGAMYACIMAHTSKAGAAAPPAPSFWMLLDAAKPIPLSCGI